MPQAVQMKVGKVTLRDAGMEARPYSLGGAGYADSLCDPHAQSEGDGAPRGAWMDRRLATPAPSARIFWAKGARLAALQARAAPAGGLLLRLCAVGSRRRLEPRVWAFWDARYYGVTRSASTPAVGSHGGR